MAIDAGTVARIIQARAAQAGFDAKVLGGHSLKHGALSTGMERSSPDQPQAARAPQNLCGARRMVPSALAPASMSVTKRRTRRFGYATCRMLITVVAARECGGDDRRRPAGDGENADGGRCGAYHRLDRTGLLIGRT